MEKHQKPLTHAKRLVAGRPQARPLAQRVSAPAHPADRILYRKRNLHHARRAVHCIQPAHTDHLSGKDHACQSRHRMERIVGGLRSRTLRRLLRNSAFSPEDHEAQCKSARNPHCPSRCHTRILRLPVLRQGSQEGTSLLCSHTSLSWIGATNPLHYSQVTCWKYHASASPHPARRHWFEPVRICREGKNYFLIVTFAVGAIFIASPVAGVTTTSSKVTVA